MQVRFLPVAPRHPMEELMGVPRKTGKVTVILPAIKPRNPLVVPSMNRVAGAHGKTKGAVRQQSKRALSASLDSVAEE